MGILDKLRPQSKWKHADPAVRLASLQEIGDDAQDVEQAHAPTSATSRSAAAYGSSRPSTTCAAKRASLS